MATFNPFTNPETGRTFPSATIQLTIGCNVDNMPHYQPSQIIAQARETLAFAITHTNTTEGIWEGVPEISVSVYLQIWAYEYTDLLKQVQTLAGELQQDAIGVWDLYGNSRLVWGHKGLLKNAQNA